MQPFGRNKNGMRIGGALPPNLDPSSRLATTGMGRKLGRRVRPLFLEAELGLHLTQCRLGRGLSQYQVAS